MKTPSLTSEERLFQIAQEQQGYFTASQAIEAGFKNANHPYHVPDLNNLTDSSHLFDRLFLQFSSSF